MNKILILIIILCVGTLTQISSDIYAPSLPAITHIMNTSVKLSQLSLAIYLYGVGISLLIFGALSEALGRKPVVLLGLAIMLIGSIACYYAQNINELIGARLLQGLGAGAGAGLWRAIFRDSFLNDEMAKYASYLVMAITFIVPAAPLLGGYFQSYLSWNTNFMFIACINIITMLLVIFCYKETSKHHHISHLHPKHFLKNYFVLLTNKRYMFLTLCVFACYGAFFSWFVNGPILLIHLLNISPIQFGLISFFATGIPIAISGYSNGALVKKFGSQKMLYCAWLIMLISGVYMLAGYHAFGLKLYVMLPSLALFFFGVTLVWPNIFGLAMEDAGKVAGYAGSLYSFMQLIGGAVIGTIMSHLPHGTPTPLAISFILAPIIAFSFYKLSTRKII